MKSLLRALFLSLICTTPVLTKAQTVNITGVSFSSNPTSCATNTITVSVMVGCINYPYVNTTFSVVGNTIDVDVNYSGGAVCLGAIVNNTHTSNMPVVGGGTYTVNVRTYLNSGLQATWAPQSWNVVSCGPEADFDLSSYSICVPDSIVATNTSLSSTSYSWFLNGSLISNDTNQVFYPTAPGANEIMLIASDGLSTDTFTQSVDVFLEAPTIDLGADTAICEADSVSIGIGTTFTNMSWSTGDTTSAINVGPGTYSITVSEPETCESSDTITIDPIVIDSFEVLNPAAVNCDEAWIEATPGFMSYLWSNGAMGSQINTTNSGTYSVTATSNDGCEITDSIAVDVLVSPVVDLGNDTSICSNIPWNLLLDPGVSGSNLWSDGQAGNFLGVSGAFGTYWVEVTDNNGCTGTDTITISEKDCSSVGIEKNKTPDFRLYPNPANNIIYIEGSFTILSCRIYSIQGQLIKQENLLNINDPSIQIAGLENGIYIVDIITDSGAQQQQFVIAR
jgi:hypothetical protein